MHLTEGGLDDPCVIALLEVHVARVLAETGRGSGHALDLAALMRAPGLTFWSAWEDESRATLVGIVALNALSNEHGELKSMHVAERTRRRARSMRTSASSSANHSVGIGATRTACS